MIKETSFNAYKEIKQSGKVLTQKLKIYFYIKDNLNVSRNQIALALGLRINAVCGRVNKLLEEGHIEVAEISPCPITGKNVEKLCVRNYSEKGEK